ncbi:MAG: glycerophosphodiester phosphodiesterase [Muricauda sp.]|nr:glycerophosphodiester phosphodiesterase [Allomuricauda sp.]
MKNNLLLIAVFVLILNSCKMKESKPLVIGHRGAMGHETENTLASIQKAMDLGVDMTEIDVFKIRSGEIVVFHDDTVERLTNGTGNVEEYNLDSLKQLSLKGNHKIPTLEAVMDLIDNKVSLNIELKGSGTAVDVNTIVESYVRDKGWSLDHIIISSFKWDELEKMRDVNPTIQIAVLTDKDPLEAIEEAKTLKAVAINPHFKSLTSANTAQMHEEGLKVYPWTINEPEDIQQMKDFGVDGIITNFPERVH